MKLALGTVQFGLDYGISNTQGMTSPQEVASILEYARQHDVTVLDTAPLYGNSEKVLGKYLRDSYWKVVTKTKLFSNSVLTAQDGETLKKDFAESLSSLKQENIYGVLIHHVDDLLKPGSRYLFGALDDLRSQGLVYKIGVSVYTKEQIDRVLDCFDVDIIQIPINVLDQRMLQEGYLEKLKQRGIEIHGRSIFLQGLLLMEYTKLPVFFKSVRQSLEKFHNFTKENSLTLVQAALAFVCSLDLVDSVVCGVNNLKQWKELVAAAQIKIDPNLFSGFAIDDTKILNPALWEV